MSIPENTDGTGNVVERQSGPMKTSVLIRCLLALVCSHLGAPYAAARVTIRYLLGGGFENFHVIVAVVSIVVGAVLAFRQLVNQSAARKLTYGGIAVVLWFASSFTLLAVAADSAIPRIVLGSLWAFGTLWVAWSVWAFSFFRARGVLVGSLLAGFGALLLWSLVDVTGLTGDAVVEFAWRKYETEATDPSDSNSGQIVAVGVTTWSGYLGDKRDGRISDVLLHEDWETHAPQETWRVGCGLGWSSFAATETALFSQEQFEGVSYVTARDITNGELLWSVAEDRPGFVSGLGGDGPRATPTLWTEGSDAETLVYVVGATGLTRCLNAATGEAIWQTDLMASFPGDNLMHGVCGSPLVVDDVVIVCPPIAGGPCLVALNRADGSMAWKCSSDWKAAYASPQLMTICEQPQIVLHAAAGALGVNPSDGTVLWQFEWTNEWDNNATQPLQLHGQPNDLVLATGYRGGAVRISLAKDSDGQFAATEVWQTRSTMKTKFCNMAQFGDVLVGLDNGIMCGVDAETGKKLWKRGRYGHGQMLQVGEHLLVVAERGELSLLKPNRKGHNSLGKVAALDRKTWNHPVLIDDRLYLRNDQQIVCLKMSLLSGDGE